MLRTYNARCAHFLQYIIKAEPTNECHHFVSKMPKKAEKLTFIALARTYNVRVSKDTVREQHV